MSETPQDKDGQAEPVMAAPVRQKRSLGGWFAWGVRSIARLWVVCLLIAAAIASGVSLNQMFTARADLDALREAPGADAYAVVAYRAELRRQLDAYKRDRGADATPTPPARPRLVEEIDIARLRNADNVAPPAPPPRAGPQSRRTRVVTAPD